MSWKVDGRGCSCLHKLYFVAFVFHLRIAFNLFLKVSPGVHPSI